MPEGMLRHVREPPIEPDVHEISGAIEIPITGWKTIVRGDTVRLVCYIKRGIGPNVPCDVIAILHAPKTGFVRSLISAVWHWRHPEGSESVH